MRATVRIASLVLLVSFFLPAATKTPGYEAFWISLAAWGDIRSWDGSTVLIALAWLANLGAIAGASVVLSRRPSHRGLRWAALLTVLAVGPGLVVIRELRMGYYLWAAACLSIALVALLHSNRSLGSA